MKNKPIIITVSVIAGAILCLAAFTHLFSNAWHLLTEKKYFIPSESNLFTFKVTKKNRGSGNWWLSGEDRNYYYLLNTESESPHYFKEEKIPGRSPLDRQLLLQLQLGEEKAKKQAALDNELREQEQRETAIRDSITEAQWAEREALWAEEVRKEKLWFDALPPISADVVEQLRPAIGKWLDFGDIDLSQAKLIRRDSVCLGCPSDEPPHYRPFMADRDDTPSLFGVDYSPDRYGNRILYTTNKDYYWAQCRFGERVPEFVTDTLFRTGRAAYDRITAAINGLTKWSASGLVGIWFDENPQVEADGSTSSMALRLIEKTGGYDVLATGECRYYRTYRDLDDEPEVEREYPEAEYSFEATIKDGREISEMKLRKITQE